MLRQPKNSRKIFFGSPPPSPNLKLWFHHCISVYVYLYIKIEWLIFTFWITNHVITPKTFQMIIKMKIKKSKYSNSHRRCHQVFNKRKQFTFTQIISSFRYSKIQVECRKKWWSQAHEIWRKLWWRYGQYLRWSQAHNVEKFVPHYFQLLISYCVIYRKCLCVQS